MGQEAWQPNYATKKKRPIQRRYIARVLCAQVKRWSFGKRSVSHNLFECPASLDRAPQNDSAADATLLALPLQEPPEDCVPLKKQAEVGKSQQHSQFLGFFWFDFFSQRKGAGDGTRDQRKATKADAEGESRSEREAASVHGACRRAANGMALLKPVFR